MPRKEKKGVREDAANLFKKKGGGAGTKTGLWEGGDDGGSGFRASGWSGGSVGMSPAQLNEALFNHMAGKTDATNVLGTSKVIQPEMTKVKPLNVHPDGSWDCPQCEKTNDHFLDRCLDCNTSRHERYNGTTNFRPSGQRVRIVMSHSCPKCGWLHFHRAEICIGCGEVNEDKRQQRLKREAEERKRNPTGLDKTLYEGIREFKKKKLQEKLERLRKEGKIQPIIEEEPEESDDSDSEEDRPAPPAAPHPDWDPDDDEESDPDEPLFIKAAGPGALPPPPPPPDAPGGQGDDDPQGGAMVVSDARPPARGTPSNSDSELSESTDSDDAPQGQDDAVAPRILNLSAVPDVEDSSDES